MHALPFCQTTHLSAEMGIYAQDKWTYKRATINAGLRFDYFKNNFPEQQLGPTVWTPTRNVTIPAVDYSSMKDITPRVGLGIRRLRQREDGVQAGLGQVRRRRRSDQRQPDFESVLHRSPQLDAEARRSVRRTTTRRNATC